MFNADVGSINYFVCMIIAARMCVRYQFEVIVSFQTINKNKIFILFFPTSEQFTNTL